MNLERMNHYFSANQEERGGGVNTFCSSRFANDSGGRLCIFPIILLRFGITDACVAAFALIWFSITISFKGANMPDGWFDLMVPAMESNFHEGSMSIETGGKQKFKHLQIACCTYASSNMKQVLAGMRKMIREILYVRTGDPISVCLKTIKPGDEVYLVGYTLKDWGKRTFKNWSKGLTDQFLASARMRYARVSQTSGKNKISVTPSNVVQLAYAFYTHDLSPMTVPTLVTTLKLMIQSQNYVISSAFLTKKTRLESCRTAVAGISRTTGRK